MPVAILSPDPHQNTLYIRAVEAVAKGQGLSADLIPRDFRGKYVAHLSFGAYFAAIGNWEATETLATAALAFVDGQDAAIRTAVPQPVGDEAAYLLAVAQRHRIRGPRDFPKTEASLDEFEMRYELSAPGQPNPRAVVERASLALNRAFAVQFLGETWAGSKPFDADEIMASLDAAEAALINQGDEVFRRLVKKQIYAVLTGIGILNILSGRASDNSTRISIQRGCDPLLRLLAVEFGDTFLERASRSRYISIILAVSLRHQGRPFDREQLVRQLDQAQADPPEMPFDRPMYQAMARLIQEDSSGVRQAP